jgi:hypothetical protein
LPCRESGDTHGDGGTSCRLHRAGKSRRRRSRIESHATNDKLRLRLNADRRERFGDTGRMLALVCECSDPSCHRTVLLSPEEYDSRRPGLVLHPAHEELR